MSTGRCYIIHRVDWMIWNWTVWIVRAFLSAHLECYVLFKSARNSALEWKFSNSFEPWYFSLRTSARLIFVLSCSIILSNTCIRGKINMARVRSTLENWDTFRSRTSAVKEENWNEFRWSVHLIFTFNLFLRRSRQSEEPWKNIPRHKQLISANSSQSAVNKWTLMVSYNPHLHCHQFLGHFRDALEFLSSSKS